MLELTNQHRAILCHMKRGAVLSISNASSVNYPDGHNVPVNTEAAEELAEFGIVREVATGQYEIAQAVGA
jgi:hypothetical protein